MKRRIKYLLLFFLLFTIHCSLSTAVDAQEIVGEYSVGEKFAEVNIQGYTSYLVWGGKINQNSACLFIISSPENLMLPTGYRWLYRDDTAYVYSFTLGGNTFELKPKLNNRVKVWRR